MSVKAKERKVQLPMQRREASLSPASFNKEERTIEMVWSVGSKGLRSGWGDSYYEELSMDPKSVRMGRLQSGTTPFCDSHNSWSTSAVLGVVQSAKIENGIGSCVVRLMDPETIENPDAKDTLRKIEAGILKNVSVGYNVYRYERQPMADGEDIPTYTATDWEPMEISIVPIGFDENAAVRSKDASAADCVFINNLPTERNEEARTMNEEEKKKLEQEQRAAAEKSQKEAAEKAAKEAREAEQARQLEIRSISAKLGLGADFEQRMSASSHDISKIRDLAIDEKSKAQAEVRNATASISVGEDSSEKWQRGASAWLIQRAGASVAQAVEKQTGQKAEAGEFRGMSLTDLARESLERAGVKTRGMNKMDLVGRALTLRATGMQSTSDFAVLLENTMHKVLLAAYGVTPDTWTRFCKTGSLADFRPHPRYRRGTFGALDAIGEHGEIKSKAIPDAKKESITGSTKGNIIALSRQSIVNDDMGAFSDLAMMMGRAAKLSIEMDVYALLASNGGLGPVMNDGLTLFHASHLNIGTGAALSAAAIDGDRVVMASQTDPSGNEILDLRPALLVLPVALGGQARVINNSLYDPDNVASGSKAVMKPNVVAGLFKDVVDTARLTGTRRYLFADPSIAPTIEVAFLDGQQAPYLEVQDGFKIDGVEWKVRIDYGVGGIDYRGAVTNAGQ